MIIGPNSYCTNCNWEVHSSLVKPEKKLDFLPIEIQSADKMHPDDVFKSLLLSFEATSISMGEKATMLPKSKPDVQISLANDGLTEAVLGESKPVVPSPCGVLAPLSLRLDDKRVHPSDVAHLCPVRVRLRSKRTLRCRRDAEMSKMSILLQPRLLPLDGDSSMKIHKGNFFSKDSSAVHMHPCVVITRLPDAVQLLRGQWSRITITISNPRDTDLHVSLRDTAMKTSLTCSSEAGVGTSEDGNGRSEVRGDGLGVGEEEKEEEFPPFNPRLVSQLMFAGPIDFNLAAYEDELFRDASATAEEVVITQPSHSTSGGAAGEDGSADGAGQSPLWTCKISQDSAVVDMPVRVTASSTSLSAGGDAKMFGISMAMILTVEGSASIALDAHIYFPISIV